jgi:pullulanase/glycogen debranching enzyme
MAQRKESVVQESLPYPGGATWDGKGTNFALFTANATKVELCLFECEQTLREFKEMVARSHEGGLAVILDVVYNHTAEGSERGPTLA